MHVKCLPRQVGGDSLKHYIHRNERGNPVNSQHIAIDYMTLVMNTLITDQQPLYQCKPDRYTMKPKKENACTNVMNEHRKQNISDKVNCTIE